jgi:hypothetical protein
VCKRLQARVVSGSLIHVDRNSYSVPSRLIGEKVEVRLFVEHLEVWYAQKRVERLPRLRGRDKHRVNYRHVTRWAHSSQPPPTRRGCWRPIVLLGVA